MITSCTWLSRSPCDVIRTKLRLRPELLDRAAPGVPHPAAEAADELVEDRRERAAVRHAPLDPLGDELLVGGARLARSGPSTLCASRRASPCRGTPCSCAPGRARARPATRRCPRRASRSSPLLAPAAIALVTSPEYFTPPSAMIGIAVAVGDPRAVADGGDLRDADPGDDARRADAPRADADLHRVGPRVDERLGRLGGRDVAGDDLDVRVLLLRRADGVDDALRVPVRGVDDDDVDPRGDERGGALARDPGPDRWPRRRAGAPSRPCSPAGGGRPGGCP